MANGETINVCENGGNQYQYYQYVMASINGVKKSVMKIHLMHVCNGN